MFDYHILFQAKDSAKTPSASRTGVSSPACLHSETTAGSQTGSNTLNNHPDFFQVTLEEFKVALVVKNLPANEGDERDAGRKIPWRREWLPTPVFLPGKSHGQRSLVGYSPWGHKELDTT